MRALVDIGNTGTKIFIFSDNTLVSEFYFQNFNLDLPKLDISNISECFICSVVPEITPLVESYFISHLQITPKVISHSDKFNIDFSLYTPQNSIGLDRIIACEGALVAVKGFDYNLFVVLTLGTATTINVIDVHNKFVGGIIAPGIGTMLNSLHQNTSQLPQVDANINFNLLALNTNDAILSGAVNSTIGLLDRVISQLNNSNILVFATGGYSYLLKKNVKAVFDDYLIAKGLLSFSNNNHLI